MKKPEFINVIYKGDLVCIYKTIADKHKLRKNSVIPPDKWAEILLDNIAYGIKECEEALDRERKEK